MQVGTGWSKTWTFFEGAWHEGNIGIMGPRTHGVVFTPIPNGGFLAGITRQRVIGLLRQNGVNVVEKTMSYQDFEKADEIFATGNYSKVVRVTRISDRTLPIGPIYTKARELYWAFAHS